MKLGQNIFYSIICSKTASCYIGATYDYNPRIREHLNSLKKGKHYCKKMQEDFNNYGIDFFEIAIVEYNDDDNRTDREMELVREFSKFFTMYNSQVGKIHAINKTKTDEEKLKKALLKYKEAHPRKSRKSKKVA